MTATGTDGGGTTMTTSDGQVAAETPLRISKDGLAAPRLGATMKSLCAPGTYFFVRSTEILLYLHAKYCARAL